MKLCYQVVLSLYRLFCQWVCGKHIKAWDAFGYWLSAHLAWGIGFQDFPCQWRDDHQIVTRRTGRLDGTFTIWGDVIPQEAALCQASAGWASYGLNSFVLGSFEGGSFVLGSFVLGGFRVSSFGLCGFVWGSFKMSSFDKCHRGAIRLWIWFWFGGERSTHYKKLADVSLTNGVPDDKEPDDDVPVE